MDKSIDKEYKKALENAECNVDQFKYHADDNVNDNGNNDITSQEISKG